jgi:CheY-like chemotaxis protein
VERIRVLVIEDDPELRSYIARCLTAAPARMAVVGARSGNEALEALRKAPADVVITDVLMADLDGLSFCRRLDERPELGSPPVLFITGDAESMSEARTYAEGRPRRAVLGKPFNATLLLSAVGRLLEGADP